MSFVLSLFLLTGLALAEDPTPELQFMKTAEAKKIVRGGERLAKWIVQINKKRRQEGRAPILLSGGTDGLQVFDMDNPYYYSPRTLRKKLSTVVREVPLSLRKVVYQGEVFSPDVPEGMSDAEFVREALRVRRLYEECLRWKFVEENINLYTSRRNRDVRQYYQLKKIDDLEKKLKTFSSLPEKLQKKIGDLLVQNCQKASYSRSYCRGQFEKKKASREVLSFYKSFWYLAEYWWKFIREIPRANPQLIFDEAKKEFVVYALDPGDERVRQFLKQNIEEEYKLAGWTLRLEFTRDKEKAAFSVRFEKNAQPHAINQHLIVMNKSQDLEETATKHAIRHEFGHILGFKDCYLEFYEPELASVVYYEVDRSDLMCSRVGVFNHRMLQEMISTYSN